MGKEMKYKFGFLSAVLLLLLSGCSVTRVSELPTNEFNFYKIYHKDKWAFTRIYVDNSSLKSAVSNAYKGLKCKLPQHQFLRNNSDGYIVSSTSLTNQPISDKGRIYLLFQIDFEAQTNETEVGVNWLIIRKVDRDEKFYVEETSAQEYFNFDFEYLKKVTESYDKCGDK